MKEAARKGPIFWKNYWEAFQRAFCVPLGSITQTGAQSCVITRKGQIGKVLKNFPSSVVVWNGNGAIARWIAPNNEIKSIIHATDPDLFRFLESKPTRRNYWRYKGLRSG